MQRPMAGPFLGSMPANDVAEVPFSHLLDMTFGALAVGAAGCVWTAAFVLLDQPDLPSALVCSCVAMLLPSLLGLWLMEQADDMPRTILAKIYDVTLGRLSQAGRLAVPPQQAEGGFLGLAALLGDLAVTARRFHLLRFSSERAGHATAKVSRAIDDSRYRASQVASEIRLDAANLAKIAGEADVAVARLAGEVAATAGSFEVTDGAVSRAIDAAINLAGCARTTAASTERMSMIGVRLSEMAHDAHRSLAGLDDRSAKLDVVLEQVGQALVHTMALAESAGIEAARTGTVECGFGRLAAEMQTVAISGVAALDASLAVIRDLAVETGQANRRVAEISELVRVNHEVGHAVGQAVMQQSESIAGILRDILEARSGFATLRAGVEAVTRAVATQSDTAATVRNAIQRLPGHAENVASLLRGLPDFEPPADY